MRGRLSLLMILGILLLGCSTPQPSETAKTPDKPLESPSVVAPISAKQEQTLPISAKAIVAGKVIQLEVAQTPQQQQIGLMNRTSLADDRGMLFPFDPPQPARFWMKNTLIPLDMIFLRNGVVSAIAANVPPCTSDPCPIYGPGTTIDRVMELRGGRAAELGLKAGDRLTIEFLNTNSKSPTPSSHL